MCLKQKFLDTTQFGRAQKHLGGYCPRMRPSWLQACNCLVVVTAENETHIYSIKKQLRLYLKEQLPI